MLGGVYNAATALDVAEQNQDVIAKNLANMHVGGYRRGFLVFEPQDSNPSYPVPSGSLDEFAGFGTHVASYHVDHSTGPIERTDRSLDVAISGDGYLVLDGPNGPLYTRNGALFVGQTGQLVDVMGRTVQGEGGPLTVPPDVSPSSVQISPNGAIRSGTTDIGQLKLVRFDDPAKLIRSGSYTFSAPPEAPPQPSEARLIQGSKEGANVNPVEELIRMTIGMRHYEAAQRALRAISDTVEQSTSLNVG